MKLSAAMEESSPPQTTDESTAAAAPSFREAVRLWHKIGWTSFGGPAGQIALMHRELVDQRRWVGESTFLHALNFCMLLPGPEAQQLATYLGWRMHGLRGAITAGSLFVLPSALILWVLSWLFMAGGRLGWVQGLFHGLMPAVIAIVVVAIARLAGKSLKSRLSVGISLAAFGAVCFLGVPFPAVIASAAVLGWAANRWWTAPTTGQHGADPCPPGPAADRPWSRAARTLLACLALWWLPVAAIGWGLGTSGIHFQLGLFFSKAAMVTFGGAYAVLPYVSQQVVAHHGWLDQGQMMAGLALAETTPGPLIMVLQFVGFAAAWQHPGNLPPLAAATMGAALTTWVTFVPCFLMVLLGAPHVETLRRRPALGSALAAVTAAVVGVMLNLALWFAGHAMFPGGRIDWFVVAAALAAWTALTRFRWPLPRVLALCGGAGLALHLLGGA